MNFLNKLDTSTNSVVHHIHQLRSAEHDTVYNLAEKYNCAKEAFINSYTKIVQSHFKGEIFP